MTQVHERERELHREVAARVEGALPAVEVLAVELRGPEQLCVYVDRPEGVDHELCVEVTGMLRAYLERYGLEGASPGRERALGIVGSCDVIKVPNGSMSRFSSWM